MLRIASSAIEGGWIIESQRESHVKLIHPKIKGIIIYPNHGSKELGKGIEKKIKKQAGLWTYHLLHEKSGS